MSAVVRCDGPGCDVTTDPDSGARASWLTASRGVSRFDFHSPTCLAEWASAQPDPKPTPTAAIRSLCDPSTTVVDGL